jgi:hypothetical protein
MGHLPRYRRSGVSLIAWVKLPNLLGRDTCSVWQLNESTPEIARIRQELMVSNACHGR